MTLNPTQLRILDALRNATELSVDELAAIFYQDRERWPYYWRGSVIATMRTMIELTRDNTEQVVRVSALGAGRRGVYALKKNDVN